VTVPDKIKIKLREMPDKPGCYMMRNRIGRIIYVGKARSLRKRLQTYFRPRALKRADPKLRSLIKSAENIDFIVTRSEAEAILTEGRLIKEYRPKYNVSFKDDKRFLLLKAEVNQMYPVIKLCRIKKNDGNEYFGPYVSSRATRTTLDFVEKKFGIRKCTPAIPDENTYKHCLNDIIRHCSAPCINKISQENYRKRFEETCEFLRGHRLQHLKDLKTEMEKEAQHMRFEKAAALRDMLISLHKTIKQNARARRTPEMEKERRTEGLRQLKETLKMKNLPIIIEAYDVSNISGTSAVASMVCAVNGIMKRDLYRRFRIKDIHGANDPGMMAETIRRRFNRILKERKKSPDLILVDGGITQLRAAQKELNRLKAENVTLAGLAKKMEDIYLDKSSAPARLPADSAALAILQTLRDEAHRFALAYHHKLRNRLIRDSALDEIPGIGPHRKKLLLQHFGSVNRIAQSTEEEIANIQGIGKAMARTIKKTLQKNTSREIPGTGNMRKVL